MGSDAFNSSRAGGEFFRHLEKPNGDRHLIFGKPGDLDHGHVVLDPYGRPKYIRETDGRIVCNDRYDDLYR